MILVGLETPVLWLSLWFHPTEKKTHWLSTLVEMQQFASVNDAAKQTKNVLI